MDKRERKLVLRKFQANWQQTDLKNNENTRATIDSTSFAPPAPAESNQIEYKNKNTTKTKKKAAPQLKNPPPPVDPPLMRREAHNALLEGKRKRFEKARDLILEKVPAKVKERFGQIYFSKWGKQVMPCLVLNPYSVAPGGARDMWLDMFGKVRQANRLETMRNLVYWYGSHNDPENAYSFLPTKLLTTYEKGVKKKFDQVSPKLLKKLEQGKLSATQRLLVEGLEEMKADLNKKPGERSGKIGMDFMEAYEISTDDDEHNDEHDDELEDEDVFEESSVGTKSVKKEIPNDVGNMEGRAKLPKKRKKDEELSSIDSEVATLALKTPKKSKSITTEVNPTSSVEAHDVHLKPIKSEDSSPVATNQDDVDNFGDADTSSHDEPDEDYEQAMASELAYAPLIRRWKECIHRKDKVAIAKIYKELLPDIDNIHLSFIAKYGLARLLERSKGIIDNDDRKSLECALRLHYLENTNSIHFGFKPTTMKESESIPAIQETLGRNQGNMTSPPLQSVVKVKWNKNFSFGNSNISISGIRGKRSCDVSCIAGSDSFQLKIDFPISASEPSIQFQLGKRNNNSFGA